MKFRKHLSALSDSMKTVIEVNSIEDIKANLKPLEVDELKFQHMGHDERIDWDTYYVLQRLKGSEDFTVAGMSNGIF